MFANGSTKSVSKSTELSYTVPSTWLVSHCDTILLVLPSIIVRFLPISSGRQSVYIISQAEMTFRFDYSLTLSPYTVVSSTEPVPVPGRITDFPAPLFSTAIVSLLFSILATHALAFMCSSHVSAEQLGIFVYAPVMICSIAAHAWVTGSLAAWWAYKET